MQKTAVSLCFLQETYMLYHFIISFPDFCSAQHRPTRLRRNPLMLHQTATLEKPHTLKRLSALRQVVIIHCSVAPFLLPVAKTA
jgi:hypothetical protein